VAAALSGIMSKLEFTIRAILFLSTFILLLFECVVIFLTYLDLSQSGINYSSGSLREAVLAVVVVTLYVCTSYLLSRKANQLIAAGSPTISVLKMFGISCATLFVGFILLFPWFATY